jgi:exopolyphosphatase/guanosine-5'-triphosphate,3'-diphosphate pyrophosphatase
MGQHSMNIAVIDIGTNSIHMLVVRIDAELKAHVLDRAKEMVRLGEGTFETGRIDEATQARAMRSLKAFARLAEKRGVEKVLAVATSAVREAENGGAFLQEVYSETGIHPRIITGAEEARLVFKAVQSAMPLDENPVLVVDLGGGSAELACGNSRGLQWAASLKTGVQRLQPLALDDGEPSAPARKRLAEAIARELAPVATRARNAGIRTCYVTSGSASATLKLARARGLVREADESLPKKALEQLDEDLSQVAAGKRRALAGLDPARADLIVGAVAFFRTLAEQTGVEALVVSDRGLREGVLQDYLDLKGPELQWELTEPNSRRRAVLRLGERLSYDAPHAHHVAHLAVTLFDATRALHNGDERARELLEYGALLHDVGYAVNEKAHHKHSEYLILHGLSGGFTEEETRVIAAIARYHRKSAPKEKHENWAALGEDARKLVLMNEGLLRLADALDRSHTRAVSTIEARVEGKKLLLALDVTGPIELELWAANNKADWIERELRLKPDIRVARDASQGASA